MTEMEIIEFLSRERDWEKRAKLAQSQAFWRWVALSMTTGVIVALVSLLAEKI